MIKKTKKIIGFLFLFWVVLGGADLAFAGSLNAYLFYGEGCPHCAKEEEFLYGQLQKKYPDLHIYKYEVYLNQNNLKLFEQIAKQLRASADGVPFLIIGDQPIVGYADGITSKIIEQRVAECYDGSCPDSVGRLLGIPVVKPDTPADDPQDDVPIVIVDNGEVEANATNTTSSTTGLIVDLPFVGAVDVVSFSLPLLTVLMGALDGFNPCAMWALLFLISLLLKFENRKRMWLLGSVFIVASAFVYFLFMVAWLKLIMFLGFVVWVRIGIGLLALFGGGYSLKEFFTRSANTCSVAGSENKQKFFEKMRAIASHNSLWLALGGIIVLAFAVNLVELICSAGLPAIYTQVLALNDLAGWQYYSFILLYIFFFMIDDLFVFIVAMATLEMTGVTTKYAKASRLIGGLVLLAIGLLLIFKPGLLMFG